jgi:hypothetical protein
MFSLALIAAIATNAAGALVPLDALTDENRVFVEPVMKHPTLRRDFPARTFCGRHEQFELLLDNMSGCSVLAEALGLIKYRVAEQGAGRAYADDREGARGWLQQVYRAEGQRVYYVEGTQGGLFQVLGRGVVVVRYWQRTPDEVEYSGRMLIKIDNKLAAMLAQAFFLFVKHSVDRHFSNLIAQPVTLTGLALDAPAELSRCIGQMSAEDRRLLAPFAASLRQ